MGKRIFVVTVLLLWAALSVAQEKKNVPATQSVWSVAVPPFTTLSSSATMTKAVLTPAQAIVVTRVEAFSERGPIVPSSSGSPKQCPTQFALQISNGSTTQIVPISNEFHKSSSAETYTNSGKLNLLFAADIPISLSLIVPEPGFPPAQCTCNGLNVAIQYRAADATR